MNVQVKVRILSRRSADDEFQPTVFDQTIEVGAAPVTLLPTLDAGVSRDELVAEISPGPGGIDVRSNGLTYGIWSGFTRKVPYRCGYPIDLVASGASAAR